MSTHETESDADAYAITRPDDEPDVTYRVDLDTIAKGLGVFDGPDVCCNP